MKKIFVVWAGHALSFEDSTISLRAFVDRDEAEKFAAELRDYRELMPVFEGDYEDTPECNQRFDESSAAREEWEQKHPGGERCHARDEFGIEEVDFVGEVTA